MPTITVEETQVDYSGNSVATRALNVVSAIEGVRSAEVLAENEKRATISYEWDQAQPPFGAIEDVLAKVNLRKIGIVIDR
jgi:hypothetical protein